MNIDLVQTMLIWTLLCVWLFSWNLPISIPWKLPALCRRCCCGPTDDELLARSTSFTPAEIHAATEEVGKLAHAFHRRIQAGEQLPGGSPRRRRANSIKQMVMANRLSACVFVFEGEHSFVNGYVSPKDTDRWIC